MSVDCCQSDTDFPSDRVGSGFRGGQCLAANGGSLWQGAANDWAVLEMYLIDGTRRPYLGSGLSFVSHFSRVCFSERGGSDREISDGLVGGPA